MSDKQARHEGIVIINLLAKCAGPRTIQCVIGFFAVVTVYSLVHTHTHTDVCCCPALAMMQTIQMVKFWVAFACSFNFAFVNIALNGDQFLIRVLIRIDIINL
jgi:hypothetical protein